MKFEAEFTIVSGLFQYKPLSHADDIHSVNDLGK